MGAILRESPHTYDILAVWRYSEHAGMSIQSQPRFLLDAFRIIDSEKERLRDIAASEAVAKRDADYARRAIGR